MFVAWLGGAIAAVCFYHYMGFVKSNPVTETMFAEDAAPTFRYVLYAAMFAPFLAAISLTVAKLLRLGRFPAAIIVTLCQLVTLSTFAIARQWVQNIEISQIAPVTQLAENTQLTPIYTSPVIVFLVLFVIGVLVIAWMIRQMAIAPKPT